MADTIDLVLDTKHPDFEAQEEKYELWHDLYAGGDNVEKKSQSALVSIDTTNTKRVNSYLPQHPFESDTQYEIRKDRATYRNFAKPVTGVFLSAIWRKQPNRKLPKSLQAYEQNVDLQGSSADVFFKEHDKQAAVKGVRFIIVDSTKAPEDAEIKTQADSKALGLRPYFVYVDALNLIDWGFERNPNNGAWELSYIVIREESDEARGPFEQHQNTIRFRVWTRTAWELWEAVEKTTADNKVTVEPEKVEEGTHPVGEVPIVPIYFNRKKEMIGLSCFAEVDSLIKRIYMRDSELDKSLFDAAVPLLVTIGLRQEDLDAFVRASSNGLNIPDGSDGADAKYVEPSGNAFDATRQAIVDDERSIREIVLRIMRPDSKMAESAEAKRLDRQQLDNQLANFAQNCEQSEKRCWELAQKWLNNTNGEIVVEYNRDFDAEQMQADIIRIFQELRVSKDLSQKTLWKILRRAEVLPDDFDEDDESQWIEEDRIREGRNNSSLSGLAGKFLNQATQ